MKTSTSNTASTPSSVAPPATRLLTVWVLLIALGIALTGGTVWLFARERGPTVYRYRVVKAYPHDTGAYCQGLVVANGQMYEGTGREGQSTLRRVKVETGEVLAKHPIDARQFGEGVTVMGDRIYQLTWKAGVCYVYDRETMREVKRLRYEGQGWGLTHDGKHLIMSDGSSRLRYFDPETFKVVREVWVRSSGRAVTNLNELEYIDGEVFANVWGKDYIALINPETGAVNSWLDLTELYPVRRRRHRDFVLNGIAYDAEAKRLFVTGKNWPKLYEIEILGR